MTTHDFREFNDQLVIHFGVEHHSINAETLSKALLGFSSALKIVDSSINTGYSIELVVEAIGEGSFKITTKTVHKSLKNLFSKDRLIQNIAIGLLTSAIWYFIEPNEKITVIVNTDEYILERGDERIILPRDSEKYLDSLKSNNRIKKDISKTFKAIDSDEQIQNVEFYSHHKNDNKPQLKVTKDQFINLSNIIENEIKEDDYEIDTTVTIIKAILEKSLRKWEFKMNRRTISAPILDFNFYKDFIDHKITIAPGDTLDVRIKIYRKFNQELGIMVEKEFEVIEVYNHYAKK